MANLRSYLTVAILSIVAVYDSNHLTVTPTTATVQAGGSIRFLCSSSTYPVNWKHSPVGSTVVEEVYSSIHKEFTQKFANDFSVIEDEWRKIYSLSIENVKSWHAGSFYCVDNDQHLTEVSTELIVLDSQIICKDNISSRGGALAENSCGLAPDYIGLVCFVNYTGNSAPVLEWRHVTAYDNVVQVGTAGRTSKGTSSTSLTLKASRSLSTNEYACCLNDRPTESTEVPGCFARDINMLYAINATDSDTVTNRDSAKTCRADTNMDCKYGWRMRGDLNEISIPKQVLHLNISPVGTYECLANCRVNNQVCMVRGMEILFDPEKHGTGDFNNSNVVVAVVIPVMAVVVMLVICAVLGIFLLRYRRKLSKSIDQESPNEANPLMNGHVVEECKPINETVQSVNERDDKFKRMFPDLLELLDPQCNLLSNLANRDILTFEESKTLKSKIPRQGSTESMDYNTINTEILHKVKDKHDMFEEFLTALKESDQTHVANYIECFENSEKPESEVRPLNSFEKQQIDGSVFCLVKLIDPYKNDFLQRLLVNGCISQQHKDRLDQINNTERQNAELLKILKRRSYADFKNVKQCLRESFQTTIVDILERGNVFTIHVKFNHRDDKKLVERKLADIITGFASPDELEKEPALSEEQLQYIRNALSEFEKNNIKFLGASPEQSVAIYVQCISPFAREALYRLHQSGRMMEILENLFRYLLNVTVDETCLVKKIVIEEPTNQTAAFGNLIVDMLEIILYKSVLIRWNEEWKTFVANETSTANGTLSKRGAKWFIRYKSRVLTPILKTILSISFNWMKAGRWERLKKKVLMKILRKKLEKSKDLLTECLDIDHGLLRVLEERNVLSKEDHLHILETNQPVVSSTWKHSVRLDMETSQNSTLIELLLTRSDCSSIQRFLLALEDTYQAHISNYVCSNGEMPNRFGNTWPLDGQTRTRLKRKHAKLLPGMKPFIPLGMFEENQPEISDKTLVDTNQMNLLEILHSKNLISTHHKQQMERKSPNERNDVLLKLIRKGSVEVFETTLYYFRKTEQESVADDLLFNFDPEETNLLEQTKTEKRVSGVAWFESRIYAIYFESPKVYVFSDCHPFTNIPVEEFEVTGMSYPIDIIADSKQGCLFISDKDKGCLWKIKMPEKTASEIILTGQPLTMSSTQSNDLIVLVRIAESYKLNIYRNGQERKVTKIQIPKQLAKPWHAVKTSTGTYVILHVEREWLTCGESRITGRLAELSSDGRHILRTFNPSVDSISLDNPEHLAINEENEIFITDFNNDRIVMVDSQLKNARVFLNHKEHRIEWPRRLCYVPHKHRLVVGEEIETSTEHGSISLFETPTFRSF